MEIFGHQISAPRLPSFGEVRGAIVADAQAVRHFGSAALDGARNLGHQGADLGRRFAADPDGTTRAVASAARHGIAHVADATQKGITHGVHAAQTGIHHGVMWAGHKIHEGADAARAAVPGDNIVSRGIRAQITDSEHQARFTVGAVGGVANEAVGLAGSVAQLGVKVTELQAKAQVGMAELAGSSSARAELGHRMIDLAQRSGHALQHGGHVVHDYATSVAAHPGRLGGDVRGVAAATRDATKSGAGTAWNATSGFVKGQYHEMQAAAAHGQGWETAGFKTGQVGSYFIPVGGEARAVLGTGEVVARATVGTGARVTTEAVAKGTTETLARTGITTLARDAVGAGARAGAETRVVELAATPAARHAAEKAGADLVARADAAGGAVRVARNGGITAQDLAGATRASGREVALYRDAASGERYLAVGTKTGVEVPAGAKLIAHTQPGIGAGAVRASVTDEAALTRLGQPSSVIIDEGGTAATRFRATEQGAVVARGERAGATVRVSTPNVGKADLDAFRARINVPSTETVAVAKTDIPALAGTKFEGASPRVWDEAKIPRAQPGPIASPSNFTAAQAHAEEDIANQFIRKVEEKGITQADLEGKTLEMHVSNATGVCNTCRQGLESDKAAGVIKQLSERYPSLKIHVTVETSPTAKLVGPSDFVVQDGKYLSRNR